MSPKYQLTINGFDTLSELRRLPCARAGYRIIKRIWKDKSPHWFRHSRITMLRRLRDEKILSTDDIKSWTGIKADRTIEGYGLRSQDGIHKVAAALMKE